MSSLGCSKSVLLWQTPLQVVDALLNAPISRSLAYTTRGSCSPLCFNPLVDEHTLRVLEFDKVLARLARHASFSAGRELALGLLSSPHRDEVVRRQRVTAEARRLRELQPRAGLGGAHDVRAVVWAAQRPPETPHSPDFAHSSSRRSNSACASRNAAPRERTALTSPRSLAALIS